jgi:hypothetical protein
MLRRSFLGGVLAIAVTGTVTAAPSPPVPAWRPSFAQPRDRVIERIRYYSDGRRDFAVFRHGTCVVLDPGLPDVDARAASLGALSGILKAHPDMTPTPMDDGNLLVRYNHPAANVVLRDVAEAHWDEIERRHLDGLVEAEVLITPLGPNRFDAFGKQALLGRAYMFMDALAPEIVAVERAGS